MNDNDNFDISNDELELLDEIYEKRENNDKNYYCNDCKNNEVITNINYGCIMCSKCNMIISKIVDTNLSITDNNNDDKKMTDKDSMMVNKKLPETSTSSILKGFYSKNIQRILVWNAIEYIEKKRRIFYELIQKICKNNNYSKCVEETTTIIYNQVYDATINGEKNTILRGDNYTSLIANIFFLACKYNKVVVTTKEISKIFNIKKTDMKRGHKILLELAKLKKFNINFLPFTTEDFIIKYFHMLNLNEIMLDYTIKIAKNVLKIKIAKSHNPESIAIGVLFLVLNIKNINISKKTISDKFQISQVTISKTYNKIKLFNSMLTNDNLCDELEKKIIHYEENLDDDITYIYNCLKYGIEIKTNFCEKFKDLNEIYENLNKLIILQKFEILNKMIHIKNKYKKIKVNNTLMRYKIYKK